MTTLEKIKLAPFRVKAALAFLIGILSGVMVRVYMDDPMATLAVLAYFGVIWALCTVINFFLEF